jgi:hypothetical protein
MVKRSKLSQVVGCWIAGLLDCWIGEEGKTLVGLAVLTLTLRGIKLLV